MQTLIMNARRWIKASKTCAPPRRGIPELDALVQAEVGRGRTAIRSMEQAPWMQAI